MISKTILLLGNKQLYVCNQNHSIVTKTRHYADKKGGITYNLNLGLV